MRKCLQSVTCAAIYSDERCADALGSILFEVAVLKRRIQMKKEDMDMVSGTSILFMVITLVISLILPVLVLLVFALANKGKKVASAWFLGAAGFFVTQLIIRVPILNMLSVMPAFQSFAAEHYVVYVLLLGFTAGLFEVIGRLAVAKIMSKELTYKRSMAAGLGHGGIEAIMLVGITYINNLSYSAMINGGTFDTAVAQAAATGVDVSSLYAAKGALISTPAYLFGLAGYERLLTMICHVAMTMLVCYFVAKKQTLKGVVIALVLHTVLDSASGLISGLSTTYMGSVISQNASYILIYGFLTIMAVVSVGIIVKVKKAFPTEETLK